MDGLGWDAWIAEFATRLQRPLDGLEALVELRATLERVERLLVERARSNGSSWQEIGSALGISRQAACARHRPFVNPTDGDSPRPSG